MSRKRDAGHRFHHDTKRDEETQSADGALASHRGPVTAVALTVKVGYLDGAQINGSIICPLQ